MEKTNGKLNGNRGLGFRDHWDNIPHTIIANVIINRFAIAILLKLRAGNGKHQFVQQAPSGGFPAVVVCGPRWRNGSWMPHGRKPP